MEFEMYVDKRYKLSGPIESLRLTFNVCGQIFREQVNINYNKDGVDRESLEYLGLKIQELGKMIERQAKYGKTSKTELPDGREIRTF